MAQIPEILTRNALPAEIIDESDTDATIKNKLAGAVYIINMSPRTMDELNRLINRPKKQEPPVCAEKTTKKYDIF